MKTDIVVNLKLQALIRERKPTIAESTMKTYASLLKSMFYRNHTPDTVFNLEWYDNTDAVMSDIETRPEPSRRPILSAIISIYPYSQVFKDYLMSLAKKQQEQDNAQEMNEKQEENWEDFSDIKETFKTLGKTAKDLLKLKTPLDKSQYTTCLNYVILSLTTGTIINPRRSLDWTEMKLKNFDRENDNYIDFENKQIVFHKYKTAKNYGEQIIELPSKLSKILRRWARHNTNDYLLTSFTKKRISPSRLTQLINAIFGKNISTSMLRHIFLTEVYQDVPPIVQMDERASQMAHSTATALQYVKKSKSKK